MSPEITKIIEQYLQNELSAADRLVFEQRLGENDKLLNEVILQRQLHEGAKRAFHRTAVRQTAKRYHFRKKVITTTVIVLVASVLTAATLFAVSGKSAKEESLSEADFTQLVEKLDSASLPLGDLPPQYFNLSQQDTVLLTNEGVLISVPDGAFALGGKPYHGAKVVQWQEALHAADIVKGGLSTLSGNRLLETQGMFGLQAFTPEGRELEINPAVGVYVQVPVDEVREGMMLFDGRKDKNGIIDWENPKPLEKLPVMADMKDLDFYPSGYEPKLNALKWKTGKKDRDSLYLSFEQEENAKTQTGQPMQPQIVKELADVGMTSRANAETGEGTSMQMERKRPVPDTIVPLRIDYLAATGSIPKIKIDGKKLFEAKCATCHRAHEDGTGPKLYQVRQKWENGGAKPGSIYQWVADWNKAAASDPYAARVTKTKPVAMQSFPGFQGKQAEIDAIFDYIDGISPPVGDHIPPSEVLGFWKPEFNNTILATRDFEKRMKSIHETCSEKVLNAYTNNLNKPIYEIDQQVAAMGYPQFKAFAKERVGGVQLDNPHINNLRRFYSRAVAELRKEAKKDRNFIRKTEKAWDNQLNKARTQETVRTTKRENGNYAAEYKLNYAFAARQLGYTAGFKIRYSSAARVYNLDKFVTAVTSSRATDTYNDASGKQATIVYNPFTIRAEDAEKYQKLMLYLFPHELNSFERVDPKSQGSFSYSLNNEITYDMALIGMNESGYFISTKTGFNKGDLGSVPLEQVSETTFNQQIEALNAGRNTRKVCISSELDWLSKEQQNYKVQRLRKENAIFRQEVRKTVYPCEGEEWESAPDEADEQEGVEMIGL